VTERPDRNTSRVRSWFQFVVLYEIRRRWEQRWVWWIIRLIPREIKKWIVVQSAVKAQPNGAYPGEVTYREMHDVWS
jgi:hypothetical protein